MSGFTYVDWSSINEDNQYYIPPYAHSASFALPAATVVGDMLFWVGNPGAYSPAVGSNLDPRMNVFTSGSPYYADLGYWGVATDLSDITYEALGQNPIQVICAATRGLGDGTIGFGSGYHPTSYPTDTLVPLDPLPNVIVFVKDRTYMGLPGLSMPYIPDAAGWTTIGEEATLSVGDPDTGVNAGVQGWAMKAFYYNGGGTAPPMNLDYCPNVSTRSWSYFTVFPSVTPPTAGPVTPLRMSQRNDGWGYTEPHARMQGNNDQSGASSTSNRIFGEGSNAYDPPGPPVAPGGG